MKEETLQIKAVRLTWDELSDGQRELVTAAKQMTSKSYSPYSRFAVGAAARLAKRMAPVRPLPSLRATQSAPQKVSPAAVVSTT